MIIIIDPNITSPLLHSSIVWNDGSIKNQKIENLENLENPDQNQKKNGDTQQPLAGCFTDLGPLHFTIRWNCSK